MTQLNGVIKRRPTVTKEGELSMIINSKFKKTDQKMLWAEAVHTGECVSNNMTTTNSTKISFVIFYGVKPNIIGQLSLFGRIA